MECLDDNAVLAYVERLLPPAELQLVAAHLDQCELCLTITCAAVRSAGAEPATSTAVEMVRGDTVGRYALVEMIGRGAMGRVYAAHDPQLDRKVALKIVRSDRFAQATTRARLSREARAMAKVTHPGVVTVYDAGELADGVFIAMELVEGSTLAHWLATEPRDWREVVRMFIAIGHGLAAAHAAGIVHRDFKPENVLVDHQGRAAVTDFGLAASEIVADDEAGIGGLQGTPRYMSPEQFAGRNIDARTDQFSFAIALYEALYRNAPFAGSSVRELSAAVLGGNLRPRPDETSVPLAVHRVLLRALQTDPAARFPSMVELLDALATATHPDRRRRVVLALGLTVVLIVGGVVLFRHDATVAPAVVPTVAAKLTLGNEPTRMRVLVEPFANATGDPRLDDTLDLVVADGLARSTHLDAKAGIDLAAQLQGTTIEALAAKFAASGHAVLRLHGTITPARTGYVITLETRGTAQLPFTASLPIAALRDSIGAVSQLTAAFLATVGESGPTDRPPSQSLDALHAFMAGQRWNLAGEPTKALEPYRRAIAADPDFVDAHQSLGLALYNLGDRTAASAELERAKQGADRLPDRKRLALLGDYYGTVGKYTDSIMTYEALLARWPGDVRTEVNLTSTAIDAGSWETALAQARRAAQDHPEIGVVRGNLVLAEVANGAFEDASRDGATMMTEIAEPPSFAICAYAIAQAMLGHAAAANTTLAALAVSDPKLADLARADLAVYDGRYADAEHLLGPSVTSAIATGKTAGDASELVALARVRLLQEDRIGALRYATLAMGTGDVRLEYLAASIALEAGSEIGVEAKLRAWAENPLVEWRVYANVLAGDRARLHHQPREAIAAYQRANLIAPSWITRERLGRAYVLAGDHAAAQRELAWCFEHRGEVAVLTTPSIGFAAEVARAIAR